ncbi:type II toxin-antitoxin system HicB family antitoxin [Pediococcus acidilactici]|uniref:type II toxin-antitoxin system HicB family antitoxin n=2 Tax=Pediococcus acidilactici TaxID=1254 RepID=UPI0006B4ABDB|nr:type II toxin-antitoxin system HicB family antitoxin [Pediococcus acidilactici]KPD34429.1 antitoxin HicB [Pediococcus acidilactici]MBM6603757.1 type II toxin-antitoxin system HicB family antitoxin [Pediococcus acidilactici]MBM6643568.1 type II toxin-antitoxin system HicB family antitoxin [Pediococcus acidilactici]MCB5731535.1 type II toxin-antitoxin system HicB family antitoxin [Pediococcus acidilactici]MCB5804998.1 type II toxin-antitoxin system HicB family antitoxin [Pediococcus acidilact
MRKKLMYPVIISEYNDDGHYYVVTSPNIKGMVTQGDTLEDAVYWAEDAIGTMLDGEKSYPKVQDPSNWKLNKNDRLVYITVDMSKWLKKNSKTVKKTITVPEYLNEMAKEQNINVSRVASEALKRELGI